ncbi:SDR family NAD(P)-dependent oxidoreductase [Microbacterium sp. zg.Y1090]|uniref:SDR family oxidoreductase n=1 Tax=Microbacterium wangruii TaxID=3049073 RepID=UPI00214CECE7|nr:MULTISPECIES: SDR family NAD(P)-dependent oxidoreductase [unclassified Microbacterium]MCR2817245.1 SDR family NAD(P)-dependent oxidoreductase [Microbacterium sp. zg.Y1090]WIM29265.1 SDR family NAD(P)-dependent oxidoreductase [Microbacterium sp. zg-Y1090]
MASPRTQQERRTVLITGAGSGTGAAAARALAATHHVVLVGRRLDRLESVAEQISAAGGTATALAWDITRGDAETLLEAAGPVDDLVLAAGLNTPQRTWGDQHMADFRSVIDTNLIAVAEIIAAALPGLRRAQGTVCIISSVAAWTASPGAGVAYRASKMALRALTDALNEQESTHGVRAGAILPGDIDTEFLSLRPAPPSDEPRRRMLAAEDVARAVTFVVTSPPHVRIDELVITPVGSVER